MVLIEELAEDIGTKPSPWKYLLSDPRLAWYLQVGPYLPAWYRLEGPGAWPGAKDVIKNTLSDLWYPMSAMDKYQQPAFVSFLKFFAMLLLGLWIVFLLFIASWLF